MKSLADFISDPLFNFPFKSSSYFPDTLKDTFSSFNTLLDNLDVDGLRVDHDYRERSLKLCSSLERIVGSNFSGNRNKSFKIFSEMMDDLQGLLIPKGGVAQILGQPYYRARRADGKPFNREDLFHIPFDKRDLVKTNRFSISGLPCLYLSNNIYTCWEELDRPNFSEMFVSRFEFYQVINFLDLTMPISFIKHALLPKNEVSDSETQKKLDDLLVTAAKLSLNRFIALFPLYVTCYSKVYKIADFIPEYILPQMLLEWVASNSHFRGIKFSSTKSLSSDKLGVSSSQFSNFALPVKNIEKTGYCSELVRSVKLTHPTTWEIENIINPTFLAQKIDKMTEVLGHPNHISIVQFMVNQNITSLYPPSSFGRLEYLISKHLAERLN